jgi:hypothetical protein
MGLDVNDEFALQYLEKLSADLIPRVEIGKIFRDTIGNRISEQQMLSTIRTELAAQNYIALTYPDLTRGQLPAQAWEYYRRLNRRVKAEIAPLNVAEFKKKVSKEPSAAEIQALYESGKDRYPEPSLPDPGFKRRKDAAFDFVRADRKKFEDEEMAKLKPQITDQEITEYYDKNKEDFRETPAQPKSEGALPSTTPSAEKPADPANPADTDKKPADTEPKSPEDKTEKSEKPETTDKPAEPATPADSSTKKAEDSPAEPVSADKPDEPAAKPTEPSDAEPKADEAKPDEAKADEAKPDEAKPDEAKPDEAKADEAKPAEPIPGDEAAKPESSCQEEAVQEEAVKNQEKKEAEQPATEKPAESPKPEAPPADAEKPKESDKPEETEKGKDAAAVPEDKPATEPVTPATSAKPGEKPAAADAPAAPERPKSDAAPATTAATTPTYKPLDDKLREEIRNRVAEQKARRAAQERVDAGLNEIRRLVTKHAQQKRTAELKKSKPPEPLDLEKVAQDRGMQAGHIPLSDSIEVQETELGKTFEFDFSTMQMQRIPFHLLAYRDSLPLLMPEEIRGDKFEIHFLYWKTDEKPPFVPELKDIRDEVVDVWKQREALTIAQADAKSLAEKAKAAGKPLAESLGKEGNTKVSDTNEFSWLTSGSVPMGMGMPALSSVDGVEHAGQEFMQSVMALKPGEVGTALNQPHTVVYVVRVVSESPPEDALREMFLQTGSSMELQQVAQMERSDMRRSWIEQIEREMAVKWERTPES